MNVCGAGVSDLTVVIPPDFIRQRASCLGKSKNGFLRPDGCEMAKGVVITTELELLDLVIDVRNQEVCRFYCDLVPLQTSEVIHFNTHVSK